MTTSHIHKRWITAPVAPAWLQSLRTIRRIIMIRAVAVKRIRSLSSYIQSCPFLLPIFRFVHDDLDDDDEGEVVQNKEDGKAGDGFSGP